MIYNPVGKAETVLLTEEGIAESERFFRKPLNALPYRESWECRLPLPR